MFLWTTSPISKMQGSMAEVITHTRTGADHLSSAGLLYTPEVQRVCKWSGPEPLVFPRAERSEKKKKKKKKEKTIARSRVAFPC